MSNKTFIFFSILLLAFWIAAMSFFNMPLFTIAVPIVGIITLHLFKNAAGKIISHGVHKIEIDDKRKSIKFGDKEIRLVDIADIKVNDNIDELSLGEKYLVKGTNRIHFSEIVITLKNGNVEKIPTSTKSMLYVTLKKLNTYIKINDDIEQYKEPFISGFVIFVLILLVIYILLNP